MRKYLLIILFISVVLIYGCAKSLITLILKDDPNAITMFGKNPERNFYVNQNITDSLKLIWENGTYGNYNNSSVVVYDSVVFVGDLGGRIQCFDLNTGKFKGVLKSKGSVYSTPLLYKTKLVYALCDQKKNETTLIYYDIRNGKEISEKEIDGRVLTQMIKDKSDIILCTENGKISKYSEFGKKIWELDTQNKILCNPAIIDSTLIVGNIDGELLFISSSIGKLIFNKKIGSSFLSGISIKDKLAFIGDNSGVLYAVDNHTGNIVWQFNTGARILMTPALDDDFIYVGNLEGKLYCLNLNDGVLKWKTNFGGILNSTPLITKNRIVITNLDRAFYIVDKINGSIKKRYDLDGRGKLTPVLVDNKIIIGYDDGNLSTYEVIY